MVIQNAGFWAAHKMLVSGDGIEGAVFLTASLLSLWEPDSHLDVQLWHAQEMEALACISLNYIPLLRNKAVRKHIREADLK